MDEVSAARRRNMQAVHSRNTKPELTVRKLLHGAGYRFRLHARELPGRPDIVFTKRRRVIEVRGCFWHRHGSDCRLNPVIPRTRSDWWKAKLEANVTRDARNLAALEARGWDVEIVWECEVRRDDLLARIAAFLGPPRVAASALSIQSPHACVRT